AQARARASGRGGDLRHRLGDELPGAGTMAGNLKIAVLYEGSDNTVEPRQPLREKEKAPARRPHRRRPKPDREQVADALGKSGYDPFLHELRDQQALLDLSKLKTDLVFNMVEAFAGDDGKEAHVAAYLELLDLRHT